MDDPFLVRGVERLSDRRAIASASSSGTRPRASRSASVAPSTNSRTIARTVEACPELVASAVCAMPWMVAMFGWFSVASARASRSKRLKRSGSSASSSGSTLIATSRPSRLSCAR